MPTAKDPMLVVFDGRGSLVSNVTAHSGEPSDFVEFVDLITDRKNRIIKRPGLGIAVGAALASISAIHEYTRINTTTGAVERTILRAAAGTVEKLVGAAWVGTSIPITPGANHKGWTFCDFNNRCFGVEGDKEMIVFDGSAWRIVGWPAPVAESTYALSGLYNTGTVSCTKGSKTVNGALTAWTVGAAWVGKIITINGNNYTIETVTGGTVLTTTEGFKEDSAVGLTYSIHSGVMTWDSGPQYAYAYYNPTTGHCTNRSPIMEITEQDQIGRGVTVTISGGGIPLAGANALAYAAGYTQIKWFRTPKNGVTLCAIDSTILPAGTVNNRDDGVDIVLTETASTCLDTALTYEEAPTYENRQPPAGILSIATYQSRLVGVRPIDQRWYFSATPEETPLGAAEECWPARNARIVTDPKQVLAVGGNGGADAIVIPAGNGDYSLEGYDNLTYVTYKLPTRGSGGYAKGSIGVEGNLVECYTDKRVIDWGKGDLGAPIQDKLDAISDSALESVRLHWYAYKGMSFLLVTSPDAGKTYVYDYDMRHWYEWTKGFRAFGTVHSGQILRLFGAEATSNKVYNVLVPSETQDEGANFTPYFKTNAMRLREAVGWRLVWVKIYVNDAAESWTGKFFLDENPTGVDFTFVADPHRRQNAQGRELEWVPSTSVRTRGEAFQFQVNFPTANKILWIEKMVVCLDPDQQPAARD